MFVHLHVHSSFSFLEGLASPSELVQAAARLGQLALALTDRGRLTGAIEFYDACREAGLNPILGVELEVALPVDFSAYSASKSGLIVLLAADMKGWSSLCHLCSAAQADPTSPVFLPFELLAANRSGLLCLTGGRGSMVNQLVLQGNDSATKLWLECLNELFPGRLYIELQFHTLRDLHWIEPLSRLAGELRIPTVASHDVYYISPEQASLQRTLTAIRNNRPLKDLPEADLVPSGAYLIDENEMVIRFSDYPEALSATQEVAERCRLELPLGNPHFPQVDLPPGVTTIQELRQKAKNGARELYSLGSPVALRSSPGIHLEEEEWIIDPTIQSRLDHELEVIEQCGYEALFLVMEEIVRFARLNGIPISSRGSAASSLVAHCLGITSPDPIRLNLYFERFLNPARATPPDIDTDLCSRRRDEVIDFVYRRFGAERVAMVCTVNRFRRRSALREVAKAYGLPSREVSAMAESLPNRWYGLPERFVQDSDPFAELADRYTSPLHRRIFQDASALIGLPRHLSIHPGGVVISPGSMADLVPTQLATKGVTITQFDLESIERLGLVKIDLLGIRGLTVLGDVAKEIRAEGGSGKTQDDENFAKNLLAVLESIPENDPATAELVQHGRTIGCFQIESPGMRATLKEVRAHSVDDLMVALALYRPGPLTGGLKDAFVARYRGLEATTYLHPALEPLLADTFGVILYQEQVLRIAHELAGLGLAEADLLRRAMSHFDPGKRMQTLKEHFIAGALSCSGVPVEIAEKVWELMAAFAGYGFPKAHAASYARVSWQLAWCKAHYPALFMSAVLANWGGYYSQRVYLMEARRLGLAIHPPNVNHAGTEFSVGYLEGRPALFMGLNQVRELTRRTQARILRQRPYRSFRDFLARVDPRPIEVENLVRAGALEDLGIIPVLLRQLEYGGWRGGQLSLFDLEVSSQEDWSLDEKAAAQEAVLGISVAAHPLELHAGMLASQGALTTVEAASHLGQRVRVAGMRQTWRRSRTSHGDYIYFLALEDLEGMLDVVIYSDVYRRSRADLSGPGPYIVEGVVEYDQEKGEPFIRAERITK